MIWVISTGEAFWQHNISRHPKHLLQHLTVIYSSFIPTSPGGQLLQEEGKLCLCVPMCVCILRYTGGYNLHITALRFG